MVPVCSLKVNERILICSGPYCFLQGSFISNEHLWHTCFRFCGYQGGYHSYQACYIKAGAQIEPFPTDIVLRSWYGRNYVGLFLFKVHCHRETGMCVSGDDISQLQCWTYWSPILTNPSTPFHRTWKSDISVCKIYKTHWIQFSFNDWKVGHVSNLWFPKPGMFSASGASESGLISSVKMKPLSRCDPRW